MGFFSGSATRCGPEVLSDLLNFRHDASFSFPGVGMLPDDDRFTSLLHFKKRSVNRFIEKLRKGGSVFEALFFIDWPATFSPDALDSLAAIEQPSDADFVIFLFQCLSWIH
jgi:MinD-like ATPase involved in chromosome partitioning or flagellar assembly